jgi:NAD(P)-dependent dehydrogenase (short-subunit alcohol dehydrogenase family)
VNTAVVLTGASTGIGRAGALRLAHAGHQVFAGVRRAEDGASLIELCGTNLQPLLLDVTDPAAIAEALATVASEIGDRRLLGLVNNAGIAVAGPVELLSMADWRRQFDVNFFGAVEMTRTFIPLLRKSQGRVVNVGSIAGKLSTPFSAPYGASKFALEAFSDSLRVELAPDGIFVSLIEPGPVRTPIWQRGADDSAQRLSGADPAVLDRYRAQMTKLGELAKKAESGGVDADVVARAIETALGDPKPRARYLIGTPARVQLALARMPEPVRDTILGSMLGNKRR